MAGALFRKDSKKHGLIMNVENIYAEMAKLSAILAEATANRVYLSEFRKSKKALLMKASDQKLSAVAQEREAYAHEEYQELLRGLQAATEHEVLARHKLKIIEMRFEAWRSKKATARAEMNLR